MLLTSLEKFFLSYWLFWEHVVLANFTRKTQSYWPKQLTVPCKHLYIIYVFSKQSIWQVLEKIDPAAISQYLFIKFKSFNAIYIKLAVHLHKSNNTRTWMKCTIVFKFRLDGVKLVQLRIPKHNLFTNANNKICSRTESINQLILVYWHNLFTNS